MYTRNASAATLLRSVYSRDLAGRITGIDGSAVGDDPLANDWTYTYNAFDWLLSADNAGPGANLDETFTYAPNGNLLTRTRGNLTLTYPSGAAARAHAPTKINGLTIGYDANGNMVSDASTSTFDSPFLRMPSDRRTCPSERRQSDTSLSPLECRGQRGARKSCSCSRICPCRLTPACRS